MPRRRLSTSVFAGFLGMAMACGDASATAGNDATPRSVDLPAANTKNFLLPPREGVPEGQELEGLPILLVDPQSGQIVGILRILAVQPGSETVTLGRAQPSVATAAYPSVMDAIVAAERHAGGGKVLEARLKLADSADTYLKVHRNNAIWEGRIDARSGEVLGTEGMIPESQLDADERAELSVLKTASTTIVDAVHLAEQHIRGRAVAVEMEETKDGGTVWEVVVMMADEARSVIIDPATGEVKAK
jgi:uncharacterized membrane protein YkoI